MMDELGLLSAICQIDQPFAVDCRVKSRRFGLLTFCELENQLSDQLGVKVDLVMKTGLKPHIGERILAEVQYL
jgi:predicted nucleotidyltransferase